MLSVKDLRDALNKLPPSMDDVEITVYSGAWIHDNLSIGKIYVPKDENDSNSPEVRLNFSEEDTKMPYMDIRHIAITPKKK